MISICNRDRKTLLNYIYGKHTFQIILDLVYSKNGPEPSRLWKSPQSDFFIPKLLLHYYNHLGVSQRDQASRMRDQASRMRDQSVSHGALTVPRRGVSDPSYIWRNPNKKAIYGLDARRIFFTVWELGVTNKSFFLVSILAL